MMQGSLLAHSNFSKTTAEHWLPRGKEKQNKKLFLFILTPVETTQLTLVKKQQQIKTNQPNPTRYDFNQMYRNVK